MRRPTGGGGVLDRELLLLLVPVHLARLERLEQAADDVALAEVVVQRDGASLGVSGRRAKGSLMLQHFKNENPSAGEVNIKDSIIIPDNTNFTNLKQVSHLTIRGERLSD